MKLKTCSRDAAIPTKPYTRSKNYILENLFILVVGFIFSQVSKVRIQKSVHSKIFFDADVFL